MITAAVQIRDYNIKNMYCTMLASVKDIDRERFYTNHKSCFEEIYNFS